MHRRSVLASVGVALSFGITGCLGDDDVDPREEVVVEYYEFEAEADELTFEQRKERAEQLFHSDSPTSEYQEYRREGYDPPFMEFSDIEMEILETDLGEDQLRETGYFEDRDADELASQFAGENGLIDVTVTHNSVDADGTSNHMAFVVREGGDWCIFSWGLPGYE